MSLTSVSPVSTRPARVLGPQSAARQAAPHATPQVAPHVAQAQFGAGNRRWWLGLMPPAVLAGALAVSGLDTFVPTTAVAQEKPAEQPVYNYVVEQWRRAAEDYGKKHEIDMSGKGQKIAFICLGQIPRLETKVTYYEHANTQRAVMLGKYGLLPEGQTADFPIHDYNKKNMWSTGNDGKGGLLITSGGFPVPVKDTSEGAQYLMKNELIHRLVIVTDYLNQIAESGTKYPVIHLAMATSKYRTLDRTYTLLERHPDQLKTIRQAIYNPDRDRDGNKLATTSNPADRVKKMERLLTFYNKHVNLNPDEGELKKILDSYRTALLKAVKSADAVFVNSFGNEADEIETYGEVGFKRDDFTDLFTLTGDDAAGYVVHVAGSDPKGTVFDLTDDGISAESMPGTKGSMPTLAAPGEKIVVTYAPKKSGEPPSLKWHSGTSQSVALTVGAVVLARQASGNQLTAPETVKLLTDTAYQHTGLTVRQMGRGLLDFKNLLEGAGKKRPARKD